MIVSSDPPLLAAVPVSIIIRLLLIQLKTGPDDATDAARCLLCPLMAGMHRKLIHAVPRELQAVESLALLQQSVLESVNDLAEGGRGILKLLLGLRTRARHVLLVQVGELLI